MFCDDIHTAGDIKSILNSYHMCAMATLDQVISVSSVESAGHRAKIFPLISFAVSHDIECKYAGDIIFIVATTHCSFL